MEVNFFDKLILRTPSGSFKEYLENGFSNILNNKDFLTSLYLASPDLYHALSQKNKSYSESEKISKNKYFLRSVWRTIPFGLFAGCSVVNWGPSTNVEFSQKESFTQVDNLYLNLFVQQLLKKKEIRYNTRYFSNNTIYRERQYLKYIETQLENRTFKDKLSQVLTSEAIELILERAKDGSFFSELSSLLIDQDTSSEETYEFIDLLIDNKILESELTPTIDNKDNLQRIMNILSENNSNCSADIIYTLEYLIKSIKSFHLSNDISHLKSIEHEIMQAGFTELPKIITHSDLVFKVENGLLNQNIKNRLNDVISVLLKLNKQSENSRLDSFKKKFTEIYGEEEVKLITIIDPEAGIPYDSFQNNYFDPLLLEIKHTEQFEEKSIVWNQTIDLLFRKIEKGLMHNKYEIEITNDELEPLPIMDSSKINCLAIMFKVINFEHNLIQIDSIIDTGATSIINRFATISSEFEELANQISRYEEDADKEVIFAEIAYLPQDHVGNVLRHPISYSHCIPINSNCLEVPNQNIINLDDIFLSVKGGFIFLRSAKHNKYIIPRLNNMHNHELSGIHIYKFLCDVKNQHSLNLHLRWDFITNRFSFVPRITYKKSILIPATWNLYKYDFASLLVSENHLIKTAAHTFIKTWKLPRYTVLMDGDKELFTDWTDIDCVLCLISTIKSRDKIVLREFIFDPNSPIKDKSGNPYTNQFVAFAANKDYTPYRNFKLSGNDRKSIDRKFSPGSEWLYFKIYANERAFDYILLQFVKSLTEELTASKVIDKWFFIRFEDSLNHIRFRVHLTDLCHFSDVVNKFNNDITKIDKNIITKVQIDTYEREIERYGDLTIEDSETLFWLESCDIITLLSKEINDENVNFKWTWCMKRILFYLNIFQLTDLEKLNFLENRSLAFLKEFNVSKESKIHFDKKFRELKMCINDISFEINYSDSFFDLKTSKQYISTIETLRSKIKNHLYLPSIHSLLGSHIHMFINRLFNHCQRQEELMIYYYLHKIAKSKIHLMSKS